MYGISKCTDCTRNNGMVSKILRSLRGLADATTDLLKVLVSTQTTTTGVQSFTASTTSFQTTASTVYAVQDSTTVCMIAFCKTQAVEHLPLGCCLPYLTGGLNGQISKKICVTMHDRCAMGPD